MKKYKGKFKEFSLIVLGIMLAAVGGYLVFNQYLYFGIIALIFSFIVHFILSNMKQNKILYGTSEPPPASTTPEGTIYMRYKE